MGVRSYRNTQSPGRGFYVKDVVTGQHASAYRAVSIQKRNYGQPRISRACALLLTVLAGCTSASREGLSATLMSPAPEKPSPRAEAFSHFLAATMHDRQGRFDEAVRELREAAKCDPESAELTIRLIRAYVRNYDYVNALEAARKAVKQQPENTNLWIVLGEIYHKLDRLDEAVEAFQKAIAIDPENVLGYDALVSIQESTNDLVAAADIYERLAALRPDVPGVHFQLGLCLARMNDPDGARAALERALELNPQLSRARYLLGIIRLEAGDCQVAAGLLAQYLMQNPKDQHARESLVAALTRLERYPQATAFVLQLLRDKDATPRHNILAMYVLLRAQRYQGAITLAPAEGAPIFGTLLRALARKGMGQPYAPVIESLDAIEGDLDAECSEYLNDLIYLFGKDDAGPYLISALETIRGEGVRSKTIDIVLARTWMLLDRYEDAEPILLEAVDAFGPDKFLHYYLAIVYEELGRVPETEQHLKEYLKLDPNDPDVLNFLAYLYAEHSMKLDEAETLLNRALELDPENGFYLDSLGWVYYRMGDADRAIELIRNSILAMDNDDAEVRDHLGDAYLLKGDVAKAIAEWKRAHRLDPTREGVKEKLDQHQK